MKDEHSIWRKAISQEHIGTYHTMKEQVFTPEEKEEHRKGLKSMCVKSDRCNFCSCIVMVREPIVCPKCGSVVL